MLWFYREAGKVTFLIAAALLLGNAAQAAPSAERLNKNGVALCADRDAASDGDCYDPVSYLLDAKAEKVGLENSRKFRAEYQGAIYVFSSQAHLDLFKKSPEKYRPQFGGWCAYAVAAKKSKVDIDPSKFYVQNGRLLLFYDGLFAHTRETWLHDKNKSTDGYLTEADANWPETKKKDP